MCFTASRGRQRSQMHNNDDRHVAILYSNYRLVVKHSIMLNPAKKQPLCHQHDKPPSIESRPHHTHINLLR